MKYGEDPKNNFRPPASFIKASQARQAKIKQTQDDRTQTSGPAKAATNTEPIPIPQKQVSEFNSNSAPGPQISRSRSNSYTSKAMQEIENIRIQREERRKQNAALKLQKNSQPKHSVYLKEIQNFREEFKNNRNASRMKIQQLTHKFQPKLRVCIRKRPMNHKETKKGEFDCITAETSHFPFAHIYLHEPKIKLDLGQEIHTHKFQFDNVFDESSKNIEIYQQVAEPLVNSFLNGGFSTIFAYGQTGSGKTHTIFGTPLEKGVCEHICTAIIENLSEAQYLTVSFVEIYGNQTFDLFNDRNKISILEDASGNAQLFGQDEYKVENLNDLLELVQLGVETRTTGSTLANSQSSRSHAILQINLTEDGLDEVVSKFCLVDLAGSERGADTGDISKQSRWEGSSINKSLLSLKECIRSLYLKRTGKEGGSHIPFRASKLTHILRNSFIGRNSSTAMIAMISPSSSSIEHTLNTLRYADRMKEFEDIECEETNGEKQDRPWSPTKEQNEELETLIFDEIELAPAASDQEIVNSSIYEIPFDNLDESMGNIENLDIQDEEEDIIEQHIAAAATATKLSRAERIILTAVSDVDHDVNAYLDQSLEILTRRIELWNNLRKKMLSLKSKLNN